jgi:hypothetical protein
MRTASSRRSFIGAAATLILAAGTLLPVNLALAAPSIGGVSLGATIGASKAELVGEVYNLKNPGDIEGTYSAVQAGVAIAGGRKVAELKNSKGVVLKVKGAEIGLELERAGAHEDVSGADHRTALS